MSTMDLIEFLRARLDEDEERWRHLADQGEQGYWDFHLAEVDAKRRILAEVVDEATGLDEQVDGEFRVGSRDLVAEPYLGTVLLRLLALPYAEHLDYREEWRPQAGDTRPD
ncbi:DUF6221 family protein [Phytohabitans aurantiacus]|uniref:Uncharacterized protein n=1 Tax=Phytohabitans aurantiacus TaxID=3016789 RepID=A0ABQ5QK32_9ACTN|nr:DUF6221 family protein [Phytohabitans aurantiacus]GLH94913.1 hypothetical protein Pa4123_01850 [Phytohabitans aurantiacus]